VQKISKRVLFLLVFIFFLMNKHCSILAFSLENEQIVTKDKVWTITFNDFIVLDELVYEDIVVMDNEGHKVNVIIELSEDKKSILVKPPIEGYELGVKYQLNISDKLQSLEGKKLDKGANVKFVIESPVHIARINNINLCVKKGQPYMKQKKATVDLSNGVRVDRDVIWDNTMVDTTKAGVYILKGKVEGYEPEVILNVTVVADYDKLIKPSPVIAKLQYNSGLYKEMSIKSNRLEIIEKGRTVEVIRDVEYKWYYVKINKEKYGWIEAKNLIIPKDPTTNTSRLPKDELEGYVNIKGFESKTKYLMWVDLDRQIVNIFEGAQGEYKFLKSIACATGRNISPTTRGSFTIQNRGEWFFKGKSGAQNWVGFNGQYLFHSIIMDANKNVKDYTLGKRASAGCIRLSINDSKWVYDNIDSGTTVWVN
jgi:lipoprotein-anchoring transpeptidase ErfK/SrfK